MPQISEQITINRPASEVFRLVADFDKVQQWQPDVTETHLSSERLRVGAFLTEVRNTHLLGWRLDLNADVVNYVPNRKIEFKGVIGRFPSQVIYEFESSGGTTVVRQVLDIKMGILYGIFSPLMKGVMGRRTRIVLEKLKTVLETARGDTAAPTSFHKEL